MNCQLCGGELSDGFVLEGERAAHIGCLESSREIRESNRDGRASALMLGQLLIASAICGVAVALWLVW